MRDIAFLFDMDGTLLDNMSYHTRAWLELLEADFGLHFDPKDWERRTAGKTTPDILRHEVDPGMPDAQVAAINHRKESLYRQLYGPHLALARGLDAFLAAASGLGIALAVCTSADRGNVAFAVDGLGLRQRFGAVVGKEDVSRGKPDPQVFLVAAARLGVSPARCVVFEDAPTGIEATRRAGMKAVAIAAMLDRQELLPLAPVMKVARDFTALSVGDVARMAGVDVADADPRGPAAVRMIAGLTADIARRYGDRGDDGSGAFRPEDALEPGAAFVIATLDGEPVGCGAIRPLSAAPDAAEVKRMYVDPAARGLGVSRLILHALEDRARAFGYRRSLLETGDRQPEATSVYLGAGYSRVPCYGQYAARAWSLCYEKALSA